MIKTHRLSDVDYIAELGACSLFLTYITSLLKGNAHRMIYPYIFNDQIDFNTIKEL